MLNHTSTSATARDAASIDLEGVLIAGELPPRARARSRMGRRCTTIGCWRTGNARGVTSRSSQSTRSPNLTRMEQLVDVKQLK